MLACTSRLAAFENAETSQKCTGQERSPAQHTDNKTDIGLCTCASTALTLQHANTTHARLVYSGQDTEQNQRCRCVHTRGKCQTAAVSLYLHAVQCVHTNRNRRYKCYIPRKAHHVVQRDAEAGDRPSLSTRAPLCWFSVSRLGCPFNAVCALMW